LKIRARRIVSNRGIRYLLAGAVNMLFGICDTLALTKFLLVLNPSQPKLMATAAVLFTSFFNIAFSFLTYKWFVFKTKGNYLKEYLRSLIVYLPSIGLNTFAVAPLSAALSFLDVPVARLTSIRGGSVYLAIVLLVATTFTLSFFGHKHVSFRTSEASLRHPTGKETI
jgi:hypothetical protein